MSEQNHQFIGISAFGQCDRVSFGRAETRSRRFLPACVILQNYGIAPLTGEAALSDSTQLGLPYPVNSIVSYGDINLKMKRALVSLIWKKLMLCSAGDELWDDFSCSGLLSLHIASLLKSGIGADDYLSVAIPNFINDHAQEYLLRNLIRVLGGNRDHVKLIWRTVAAAMHWLDVKNNSKGLVSLYKRRNGLKIGVVYLGLDAIEYSSFEVHSKMFEDTVYLVPKRTVPSSNLRFELDGFDLFESALNLNKFGLSSSSRHAYALPEIWQLLNRAEEVWPFVLNLNLDPKERVWYKDGNWVKEKVVGGGGARGFAFVRPYSSELNKALFDTSTNSLGNNWLNVLCSWLTGIETAGRSASSHFGDSADALIVTGSLSSLPIAEQIAKSLGLPLIKAGEPYRSGVWYTDEDDIAGGAAVFSERISKNAPAYTEEFERLSIIVKSDRSPYFEPVDLIEEKTIKEGFPAGNQAYKNESYQPLALAKGSSALPVYLIRGEIQRKEDGSIVEDPKTKIIR